MGKSEDRSKNALLVECPHAFRELIVGEGSESLENVLVTYGTVEVKDLYAVTIGHTVMMAQFIVRCHNCNTQVYDRKTKRLFPVDGSALGQFHDFLQGCEHDIGHPYISWYGRTSNLPNWELNNCHETLFHLHMTDEIKNISTIAKNKNANKRARKNRKRS